MSQPPPVELRHPYRAALLAWLMPGLGHFYQGRTGKGWLYAICILGLYLVGYVLGEGKVVYWRWVNPLNNPERFSLYYIGQFFVGLPALPALIQGTLHHFWPEMTAPFWGFMAEPPQNVLNGLHHRLGKLVEIGTIYTTVAGLLNILAIYDAFEGPAFIEAEESPEPVAASSGLAASEAVKAGGPA
ncbi:MAG: DUF6677 family protein [Isosphaeraceae bacterium]